MPTEDKPLQAPSLLELSANVVARDNVLLLYKKRSRDPSSSSPAANFIVELPMTVADVVVKHVCRNLRNESASANSVEENLRPFLNGEHQLLGRLDLSGLTISHRTLALLLAAQQSTLRSLDLTEIRLTSLDITSEKVCGILTDLKVKSLKLDSLKVTSCDLLRIPRFRIREIHKSNDLDNGWDQEIARGNKLAYDIQKLSSAQKTNLELTEPSRHFVEFCPNIQHLYLQQGLLNNIKDETADEFLFRIFKALDGLRTLDLSEWNFPDYLLILEKVPNLTTLILYDVPNLESCIPMIIGLKNLRCLDLSQSYRVTGQYSKPVTCLHTLVTELPNLECLDISRTNLNSDISDDDRPHREICFVPSYIAGLSFLCRPLKYLSMFNCDDGIGLHFENIPAEKICCDHGEDQIILAMEAYMSRPKMMKAVLVKSCQLYCFETGLNRYVDALHLILKGLSSHRKNSSLQISGYTAMFYILPKVKMNKDTKRVVLCELFYTMENHMDQQEMMRICVLLLYVLEIPQDFLLNYIRIAKQLVRVLIANGSSLNTQRIVLQILNSMTLRLDQSQKFSSIILELIRKKLAAGTCDIVMQWCWGVLCSMTDETPSNCERFLEADGMQLFSLCFSRFRNSIARTFEIPGLNTVLVLNMMILVGNVADFLLNYIRIAKQLVRVLIANGSSLNTQRIVLQILNSMTLRLDQSQKILLGQIGIIEIILELIRKKLAAGTCDIVMQWCWGVLCSMTEVKCLRSQLMDKYYLTIYRSFMSFPNSTKGFEISYSSAYVLAHLVSEGKAAWRSFNRRTTMEKMVKVIGAWDLSTKIWFQYRSLKPILQLLPMFGSFASQHLAVWVLANLTSTDPAKYCRSIDEEGGEKWVRNLVYDTRVSSKISILARVVLANMDTWRNPGAIMASPTLGEAIMPASQNSNPYLKKVSKIMMRFLPVWLPVSTLVIASLYIGSYERAINPSSRAIRPAS